MIFLGLRSTYESRDNDHYIDQVNPLQQNTPLELTNSSDPLVQTFVEKMVSMVPEEFSVFKSADTERH